MSDSKKVLTDLVLSTSTEHAPLDAPWDAIDIADWHWSTAGEDR